MIDILPPPSVVYGDAELEAKQNLILAEIQESFQKTVDALQEQNIDATWDYNVNSDGTIDAEIRIRTIPKFLSMSQILTRMEENLTIIPGTWVSEGFLFDPKENDNPYQKLEGYNMVQVNLQEASKLHYNFAAARMLHSNLKNANRGTTRQIFHRVHWNAMLGRPRRE
jgi:hypothetical protein